MNEKEFKKVCSQFMSSNVVDKINDKLKSSTSASESIMNVFSGKSKDDPVIINGCIVNEYKK